MGFCGGCGKQSGPEDRFCTGCGTAIKEAKISVMEETGQVIKEEYRTSTVPPEAEADLSSGTHIGDQKRGGEWLEYTTENILKFAGYQTTRQFGVKINETTSDKFYVDILATDPHVEIFVECKDYADMKLPEKILFEFIGQLNHYRDMTDKNVVGILAMTARDDSRNAGIREKLEKENATLWDGSFLEHLQNKMTEVEDKKEFHSYITNHLNIDESDTKNDGFDKSLFVRFGFFTVQAHEYIGKKFDVLNILDDIRKQLKNTRIKISNHQIEAIKTEDGTLIRYEIIVDFMLPVSDYNIEELAAKKKKGLLGGIRKKNLVNDASNVLMMQLFNILQNVYGINYVENSKDDYEKIYHEGSRLA